MKRSSFENSKKKHGKFNVFFVCSIVSTDFRLLTKDPNQKIPSKSPASEVASVVAKVASLHRQLNITPWAMISHVQLGDAVFCWSILQKKIFWGRVLVIKSYISLIQIL